MKTRTTIHAGGLNSTNHNQTLLDSGMSVLSRVRSGGLSATNHNETM